MFFFLRIYINSRLYMFGRFSICLYFYWLYLTSWCFAVDEALCHPYMAPLHNINEEPVCPRPFHFDFEQPSFTEEDIKELIWRESVKFNPDPPIHWDFVFNLCIWLVKYLMTSLHVMTVLEKMKLTTRYETYWKYWDSLKLLWGVFHLNLIPDS